MNKIMVSLEKKLDSLFDEIIDFDTFEKYEGSLDLDESEFKIIEIVFISGRFIKIFLNREKKVIDLQLWILDFLDIENKIAFHMQINFLSDLEIIKNTIKSEIPDKTTCVISFVTYDDLSYLIDYDCTSCCHINQCSRYNKDQMGCFYDQGCGFYLPSGLMKDSESNILIPLEYPEAIFKDKFTELSWTIFRNRLKQEVENYQKMPFHNLSNEELIEMNEELRDYKRNYNYIGYNQKIEEYCNFKELKNARLNTLKFE